MEEKKQEQVSLIAVLASDVKKEGEEWVLDEWSLLRTAAGECLYKKKSTNSVIMIGGGTENESKPTVAALTNRYLIGKGIPQSAIVSENVSLSTLQQLLLLQNIAEKMNPIIVAIISSEWHLPRITAMLERHPQLTHLNVRAPILLAAEEILLQDAADQWQNAIEKSRQNPETLARIAREKLGLSQIFDGTYRYR